MTSTVATSISTVATGYGNQRKIDRTSNGVLWALSFAGSGSASPFQLAYSADSGATWTSAGTIANGSGSATATYAPDSSLFIDVDDYAHVAFKDNSNGFLYYRRGTPNAARTAYTWSAATAVYNGNSLGAAADLVAFRDPTNTTAAGGAYAGGWVVHIVFSYLNSPNGFTYYRPLTISSAGVITLGTQVIIGGGYAGGYHTFPSIDFAHTGDGKTPTATPHLFVGWQTGTVGTGQGIRFKKAACAAGAWTWGAEQSIDTTRYMFDGTYGLVTMFDGTRVVMAGAALPGSGTGDIVLYERDAADTTTTTRILANNGAAAQGANTLLYTSATYDAAGNLFLLGRDGTGSSGTRNVVWRKWTRATNTLGAATTIDATGSNAPWVSARRSTSGSRVDFVYTDGAASPYTVTYGGVQLNVPPNTPGGLSPAAGSVDRTTIQRLTWVFSDPDTGDTQSQADVQWRTNTGGTTGSWQTVTVTTPNTFWDAPAATFPAGGIEWQVRTYDAQGVIGPWSSSAFFTASTPPAAPTITAPISGATIPTNTVAIQFSEPNLDAFDWRVLGDKTGVADPTVVVNVGGTVVDPTARAVTITGLPNNTTVHLQVRVSWQGLKSTWADTRNAVSYTPPPAPTVALAGNDTTGALTVTVSNPTPTGTQPAVALNEVWVDDGAGFTRRKTDLVPGGTWTYQLPISGRDYTGRVRVVAVAVNGTSTTS